MTILFAGVGGAKWGKQLLLKEEEEEDEEEEEEEEEAEAAWIHAPFNRTGKGQV